jgi:TRAP-type C4-dicarboxylate transport system substrate-binding protein
VPGAFYRHIIRSAAAALTLGTAAATLQAQTVLTVSSWVPPAHLLASSTHWWCEQLQEKTAGQVRCNILPRAVSSPAGSFDAVRNGLADVSYTAHGYTPGRFVATRAAEMPFLGNSAEALSVAYQRFYERTPELQREHKDVRVIAMFTHGPGMVFNTRHPVGRLEDLSGLKFRVGGGMVSDVAKALGMNVTLKPSTESYELLSTGVLDGTLFPAESVEAFKIDKIVRFGTAFPGGLYNTSFVFMMNPAAYDRLPPEGKKAVDELSGEMVSRHFGRAWDVADRRGRAVMQAAGVQIIQASPGFALAVSERVEPVESAWVRDMESRGMKNARQQLARMRAEVTRLEQ